MWGRATSLLLSRCISSWASARLLVRYQVSVTRILPTAIMRFYHSVSALLALAATTSAISVPSSNVEVRAVKPLVESVRLPLPSLIHALTNHRTNSAAS